MRNTTPKFSTILVLTLCIALPVSAASIKTFSPNKDGVKDSITFKFKLGSKAEISSWSFTIKSESGKLVRKFSGTGRPPAKLKWDGKDLNKRLVKDGKYLYSLGLRTPAGNQVAIAPSPLFVDRVHPTASAAVDPAIFSPNGDGIKDEAQFNLSAQDSNRIHSWILSIKDKEGAPARTISGRGNPPAAIRWDGRGDFEEDLPDGSYTFTLKVHDRAGNKITTPVQTVSIDRAGQVSTVEVSPLLFSPNGDGIKDSVTLKIVSAGAASIERWELSILNRNGKLAKKFSGKGDPPRRIEWNGMQGRKAAADGPYLVVLSETDKAGNTSQTTPQPLEIDTTPPIVSALFEPDLLSPNGDGKNDKGKFTLKAQDNNPLEYWALRILNDVGRVVRTVKGPRGSKPRATMTWRGEDKDGVPLGDGTYSYFIEAADIGGNKAASAKKQVRVDRAAPLVTITADSRLFSPNNDGVMDSLTFTLDVVDASPLAAWGVVIKNAKGRQVRGFTGPSGAVPQTIPWNGKSDSRMVLPDGVYTFVLSARDIVGNKTSSPPQRVTIGATKPVPTVKVNWRAFSPNADGFKDAATFTLKVKAFNKLKEWSLKIYDKIREAEGASARRTFFGRGGIPGTVKWMGERDDKRPLPDGEYEYQLELLDTAGNRVSTRLKPIRIDTKKPVLKASISPRLFSPNKDGEKDEGVFTPTFEDASKLASWKIVVMDAGKETVWKKSGKGRPPLSVVWNGRSSKRAKLRDGAYNYFFSATDEVGNTATTPEQIARLDTSPPEVAVQVNPDLFSPNEDGVKDETTFVLDSKDASDIASWIVTVSKGGGLAERTFKGLGRPPKSFPWDGKNDRGRISPDGVYQVVLKVTDEVGNTGRNPGAKVTVDTAKPMVVVEAETDELEDLIPQMQVVQTKQKDLVISLSSEILFDVGQAEIKSQAYATLMKVTHLIRRYPLRSVRVEGHADNVPIKNAQFKNNMQLSEARAKSIMKFFVTRGKVKAERMSSKGFGSKKPKATNKTLSGRKRNRRVEIILQKEGR